MVRLPRYLALGKLRPLPKSGSTLIRPPLEGGEPQRRTGRYPGGEELLPARGDEGNHQPELLGDPEKLLRREVRGYLAQAFLPSIPAYRLFQHR